ncbi:Acetolactate synthase large subunit [Seminavis robusta]|uniref:acetolactate synthase n=1 Tax=Seminavis robusta TaxID=568900 RepID=A0A9N8DQA2_9STRA|nr:Acetolactate synthase large subunit [Seminavis robusta]|eukprot:Sro270_g104160.1 Acetolactate synthase large subunit (819) ;mRNA; r:4631-7087
MKISGSAVAGLALLACCAINSSSAFVPLHTVTTSSTSTCTTNKLWSTTVKSGVEISPLNGADVGAAELDKNARTTSIEAGDINAATLEARRKAADYLSQYQGQSGAALVYSKLVEHGVTVVNGYSGGAVLPLLDQFHKKHPRHTKEKPASIQWITNSNEGNAGYIGEGYAKALPIKEGDKHKPVGVVVATSGPGVTNLITPLQDGLCDGVPMVVLCGQAATVAPPDAFQSAPAVALTEPCTKWSYQIKSAAEIPYVMEYAFYMARNGRPGPVFVDLPKDLQNQVLDQNLLQDFIDTNFHSNTPADYQFVRMKPRQRPDGTLFQSIFLGAEKGGLTTKQDRGLPFDVVYSDDLELPYKLEAVANPISDDPSADTHHADHHPTGKIVYTGRDGQNPEIVTKEGSLKDGALLDQLVTLIGRAKKPIIIAGQGCNDAAKELQEVAEILQIPVTTTLHALGCFDERHPLALNMMGMHGHPTPNYLVQESDLILCVGSRFDDRITGRMSDFAPEAKAAEQEGRGGVIHVDIRYTEKGKQVPPTYFVHSTGKAFLQTLRDKIKETTINPTTQAWLQRKAQLQQDFPVKVPEFPALDVPSEDGTTTVKKTPMSAQSVIAEMDRQLLAKEGEMDNSIFTTGVGIHQMVAAQLITWTQPRQMISSGSLGTMGVSLGYSIGAKLANWLKRVVSVDGDGSFNMSFTELKTVAEEKIPVKLLILDNESQMMVEYWQKLFQGGRLLAVRNSMNPDYGMLAGSFGIKSIFCDHQEDLEAKMNEFLYEDIDEPVLFHVKIERTPCLPLVAPGQPLDDMILEDYYREFDASAAPS